MTLDDLEALAKGAKADEMGNAPAFTRAQMAFACASSPDVILDLIRRVREAERARDDARNDATESASRVLVVANAMVRLSVFVGGASLADVLRDPRMAEASIRGAFDTALARLAEVERERDAARDQLRDAADCVDRAEASAERHLDNKRWWMAGMAVVHFFDLARMHALKDASAHEFHRGVKRCAEVLRAPVDTRTGEVTRGVDMASGPDVTYFAEYDASAGVYGPLVRLPAAPPSDGGARQMDEAIARREARIAELETRVEGAEHREKALEERNAALGDAAEMLGVLYPERWFNVPEYVRRALRDRDAAVARFEAAEAKLARVREAYENERGLRAGEVADAVLAILGGES